MYSIPPSKITLNHTVVAAAILNGVFTNFSDVIKMFTSCLAKNEDQQLKHEIPERVIDQIQVFKRLFPFLYRGEADGYPVLSIFGTEELILQHNGFTFCYKNQCPIEKRGRNPSVDGAVILIKSDQSRWGPFILFEYKVTFHPFIRIYSNCFYKYIMPCFTTNKIH